MLRIRRFSEAVAWMVLFMVLLAPSSSVNADCSMVAQLVMPKSRVDITYPPSVRPS
jgi:hypothetical protein